MAQEGEGGQQSTIVLNDSDKHWGEKFLPSSISIDESTELSSALDGAAKEYEDVMLASTMSTTATGTTAVSTTAAHQETNSTMNSDDDSLRCACDDDDADEDAMNSSDATVEELFASLVAKVESYNPEAVTATSLSGEEENTSDRNNSNDTAQTTLLQRAYQYAKSAHQGQCRKSGEPYITHPLGVAHIIADLKLDLSSLLTALLHDTVEDTSVTLEDISARFGEEISQLVDGVTKVGKVRFTSYEEQQSENYRKLILAMSRDIRVVLVKLADRMHNIRTLQYMPPEKQVRIARETMEIYAPLSHRLGIHWLKTELEDDCFKYLYPEQFAKLDEQVKGRTLEKKEYEDEVVTVLEGQMREAELGIGEAKNLLVTGRTKGLFSIYSKMKRQNIELGDVYDKVAFRIIVDDVADCYQALGVIHSHWKPAGTGKIKDYIALPKPNGYRSLHTTIIGPRGRRMEVQIRTQEMHDVAESGIAAHWMYKHKQQTGGGGEANLSQFAWLRELVSEVRQQHDPVEFIDSVREDLFQKEVFVFSPQGELYALARGSSVLDFAFRVHSELGFQCSGAKVNGKHVSIKHLLNNGDTVEILTSSGQTPKRDWLQYVRTTKAKSRIRTFLKRTQRKQFISDGKASIERCLKMYSPRGVDFGRKLYQRKLDYLLTTHKLQNEEALFTALGYGQITIEGVATEVFGAAAVKTRGGKANSIDKREQSTEALAPSTVRSSSKLRSGIGIVVGRERNFLQHFCKSCSPLYGESVRGVVTKGKGIKGMTVLACRHSLVFSIDISLTIILHYNTVHRLGCKHLLDSDEQRIVNIRWDDDPSLMTSRPVQLRVLMEDSPGTLSNLSRAITSVGFNIGNVNLKKLSNGEGSARIEVMLKNVEDLRNVVNKIQHEDGIISVTRG
eukprot:scaffold2066_cov172-Alexandrium_tamarense.AAC.2